MSEPDREKHWQNVYQTRGEREVSWSQPSPEPSLGLIEKFAPGKGADIVDIGGGASRLVDALYARGYQHLTVLDLSEASLQSAKDRLGDDAASVQWIAADATKWQPPQAFDIWHDRAAFHFLVDPGDREAYLARLHRGVHGRRPGRGWRILRAFLFGLIAGCVALFAVLWVVASRLPH